MSPAREALHRLWTAAICVLGGKPPEAMTITEGTGSKDADGEMLKSLHEAPRRDVQDVPARTGSRDRPVPGAPQARGLRRRGQPDGEGMSGADLLTLAQEARAYALMAAGFWAGVLAVRWWNARQEEEDEE